MLHKKPLLPADSVPVRPLDEHFLQQHTADEWVTHFSSVLSEYDTMENEVKLILLQKVQLPAVTELKELVLQPDLMGLCGKLKWLMQRRADHNWWQFKKPQEQTFVLFLAFIHEEAKRAGITLGNEFLTRQIMAQIRSRQEHTMLLDHVGDPDKLVEEVDKLLQSAFEYGPLQDDTAIVDCVSDDSESEDERVCAVTRGAHPKRGKGEERRCLVCCKAGHIARDCPSKKTANKRAVGAATKRRRPAGVERVAEEAKTGFSASLCVGVRHSSS